MLKTLFTFVFLLSEFANAASSGLMTKKSRNTVIQTIEKFEQAVKAKGFKVFARIDHAEAAKEYGKKMPASTVIIFGNPKNGTPVLIKTPTVAMDLPLKAIVWEDAGGNVFLSMNSAQYVFGSIYPRHGAMVNKERIQKAAAVLESFAETATR